MEAWKVENFMEKHVKILGSNLSLFDYGILWNYLYANIKWFNSQKHVITKAADEYKVGEARNSLATSNFCKGMEL